MSMSTKTSQRLSVPLWAASQNSNYQSKLAHGDSLSSKAHTCTSVSLQWWSKVQRPCRLATTRIWPYGKNKSLNMLIDVEALMIIYFLSLLTKSTDHLLLKMASHRRLQFTKDTHLITSRFNWRSRKTPLSWTLKFSSINTNVQSLWPRLIRVKPMTTAAPVC